MDELVSCGWNADPYKKYAVSKSIGIRVDGTQVGSKHVCHVPSVLKSACLKFISSKIIAF